MHRESSSMNIQVSSIMDEAQHEDLGGQMLRLQIRGFCFSNFFSRVFLSGCVCTLSEMILSILFLTLLLWVFFSGAEICTRCRQGILSSYR
jgi:hypothetical protein